MLNSDQQNAVDAMDTSLLIVAGAGTGKTRVLTEKVAHLIERGVDPATILTLTFTNKASDEMRSRLQSRCTTTLPFIGTFHSFCFQLLREFSQEADLARAFVIFDRDACRTLIKRIMKDLSLSSYTPRVMQTMVGKVKTGLLDLVDTDPLHQHAQTVVERYQDALCREQAVDFDDLLLKANHLLRENGAVRAAVASRYTYILIDEFQDTDDVQNTLISLIKGDQTHVIAVGDTDQTIYSWRGANIQTMLSFEKKHDPVATVFLTENYRSTKTILTTANTVIAKNNLRQDKELVTNRGAGDRITILDGHRNEDEEAAHIAQTIRGLHERGISYSDIVVLFRANVQARALEMGMMHEQVPYNVLGVRFFDRREIKDLLAYLILSQNPHSQESLLTAASVPRRGIGAKTLERVFGGEEAALSKGMVSRLAALRSDIRQVTAYLQKHTVAETVRFLVDLLQYADHAKRVFDDYEDRMQEVREFVVFADRFSHLPGADGVAQLLAEVSLSSEQDSLRVRQQDAVRLMTIHAAKGLEFPCVFIAGMEEGLFPFYRDDESGDPEEERRLCYVAITRAKDRLYVSHAMRRGIFGSFHNQVPSPFLQDIPHDLTVTRTYSPLQDTDTEDVIVI